MDYGQIKQNCPKAWEEWIKVQQNKCDIHDLMCRYMAVEDTNEGLFEWREFYDFFDENGIYITTKPVVYQLENRILIQCEINLVGIQKDGFAMKTLVEVGIFVAPTRTEAEEAAFTKAFEILEQQLNKTLTREGD